MTPPTQMSIRPARPGDRAGLLSLWERSVRATHHFLTEQDIVTLRPLVAQELAGDGIGWWVLVAPSGVLAGFLGFANDAVEALFLDPGHQGQGGGKLLIALAQELTAGDLAVDVNEQNEGALRFYQAQGFEVAGRSPTDGAGRPFPLLHLIRRSTTKVPA
jgi:putative acetyltransferase